MRHAPPDILKKICARTRQDLEVRKADRPQAELARAADLIDEGHDFAAALGGGEHVAVIAELKKASPSAGVIRPDMNAVQIARIYENAGASAMSVLTDEPFFQGSLEILEQVHETVSLPLLRKDFILDPYQVYEAKVAGASAILLIVAALEDPELVSLHTLAARLGLAALVEVHDEGELSRALAAGAGIIGVNNRDLHTFRVDIETTCRLSANVPPSRTLVSESGIKSARDVERLAGRGVDAILVGESLMRATDIAAALEALACIPRRGR